ncbi:type II toxin-antitoxin system HicA family toxin [uncultured Traorella sp.]
MEKIILADGWVFKNQVGSHRHYIHPSKKRKSYHSFSF